MKIQPILTKRQAQLLLEAAEHLQGHCQGRDVIILMFAQENLTRALQSAELSSQLRRSISRERREKSNA